MNADLREVVTKALLHVMSQRLKEWFTRGGESAIDTGRRGDRIRCGRTAVTLNAYRRIPYLPTAGRRHDLIRNPICFSFVNVVGFTNSQLSLYVEFLFLAVMTLPAGDGVIPAATGALSLQHSAG